MIIPGKQLLGLLLICVPGALAAHAENTALKLEGNTDQDTAITIKKGPISSMERDFEVVTGTDDITGDPANMKDAYASWKTACADWKKEMKELNQENQMIAISCGNPTSSRDQNLIYTYRSSASYKVRVRIRGGGQGSAAKSGK